MFNQAEEIYVLCHRHLFPHALAGDKRITYKEIPDHFQQEIDATRKVRDSIKEIILKIVNEKD